MPGRKTPDAIPTPEPAGSEELAAALSCTLPIDDLGRRRDDVARIFERAIRARELQDGGELTFPGGDDLAQTLLDFVLFERRCCSALAYELVFQPDHTEVTLRIRGGARYAAAVRAWVLSSAPASTPGDA